MNSRIKEFLRKCQLPLLLIFATAPIPLLLYAAFAPELLHLCWITPVVYGFFAVLSFLIPGKYRLWYGIAAAILLVILGASVLSVAPSVFLLAVPVLYGVLLLWGLPMAGWSSNDELPNLWYWGGILIHIIAQIVKFFAQVYSYTAFETTASWLLISFFAFAVLGMVSLTRGALSSASNGRQSPVSMQRKNLVLTLVCFSIALLVALLPDVIRAIRDFFGWLAELILNAIAFNIETPDATAAMPTNSGTDMLPAAQGESSILADILNALFLIIGSILTIAALIGVLRVTLKTLRKLWRRLMSNLSDYVANTAEDYVDEVTDTRTAEPKRKKPRLSAVDERAMTPAQRIRYRYLRLLYKHREWGHGSTARENLPQGAAALYERARYSDHPISEEEATCFTSQTKRV